MKIQENAKSFPAIDSCQQGEVFKFDGHWYMRIYIQDEYTSKGFVYDNSDFDSEQELPDYTIPCVELSKGYFCYLDAKSIAEATGDATLIIN